MLSRQWIAAVALALLPLAVAAQHHNRPDPADPDAPAPAVRYDSAFGNRRNLPEDKSTPDKVWRAANDQVGKLGGHAGHMQETPDQPAAQSSDMTAPASSRPASHGKHRH
jgi:hypothetical protein